MKVDKSYQLRFRPISEITDEQMKCELLTTDGNGHWCQGVLFHNEKYGIGCVGQKGEEGLFGLMFFAELSKTE